MSNPQEREAEDIYEAENDASPVPGFEADNSYVGETNPNLKTIVPVQKDEDPVDDPIQPPLANSDEQLGMFLLLASVRAVFRADLFLIIAQDERDAIDQSNILKGDRLRRAEPRTRNGYNEGPDEDDLPGVVAQGQSGRSAAGRAVE